MFRYWRSCCIFRRGRRCSRSIGGRRARVIRTCDVGTLNTHGQFLRRARAHRQDLSILLEMVQTAHTAINCMTNFVRGSLIMAWIVHLEGANIIIFWQIRTDHKIISYKGRTLVSSGDIPDSIIALVASIDKVLHKIELNVLAVEDMLRRRHEYHIVPRREPSRIIELVFGKQGFVHPPPPRFDVRRPARRIVLRVRDERHIQAPENSVRVGPAPSREDLAGVAGADIRRPAETVVESEQRPVAEVGEGGLGVHVRAFALELERRGDRGGRPPRVGAVRLEFSGRGGSRRDSGRSGTVLVLQVDAFDLAVDRAACGGRAVLVLAWIVNFQRADVVPRRTLKIRSEVDVVTDELGEILRHVPTVAVRARKRIIELDIIAKEKVLPGWHSNVRF
mmetsp:Transcript_49391/g.148795  ORF Transcript_49391/g.148795 Transcript_49391/m.148795 type:complete len:392 (-) Transcript_49391:3807-4982(-)